MRMWHNSWPSSMPSGRRPSARWSFWLSAHMTKRMRQAQATRQQLHHHRQEHRKKRRQQQKAKTTCNNNNNNSIRCLLALSTRVFWPRIATDAAAMSTCRRHWCCCRRRKQETTRRRHTQEALLTRGQQAQSCRHFRPPPPRVVSTSVRPSRRISTWSASSSSSSSACSTQTPTPTWPPSCRSNISSSSTLLPLPTRSTRCLQWNAPVSRRRRRRRRPSIAWRWTSWGPRAHWASTTMRAYWPTRSPSSRLAAPTPTPSTTRSPTRRSCSACTRSTAAIATRWPACVTPLTTWFASCPFSPPHKHNNKRHLNLLGRRRRRCQWRQTKTSQRWVLLQRQ